MTERNGRGIGFEGRRRGFTLLELLVVIGIMGMLIAIMIPSLTRAREQTRETQCMNRLRTLYVAHMQYLQDYRVFPPLNKEEDDGAWQYNYLIYDKDGGGLFRNFGPLLEERMIDSIETFYCPVQKDPFHSLSTPQNPWPPKPYSDTRAGYGRRYHLSGRSLSQIAHTRGFAADVFHVPAVVKSAHKRGVNAVYTDGHARFVTDRAFTDNNLATPFDRVANKEMKKLWRIIDDAK
ncbi:MAG: type II secretion system protein [Planctomycetota bacterium]|nr:MAG: type II secretion system protein [Planctomycetota bacterium]